MLWLGQELGMLKLQWSQPAPMLHRVTSKFQTLSGQVSGLSRQQGTNSLEPSPGPSTDHGHHAPSETTVLYSSSVNEICFHSPGCA